MRYITKTAYDELRKKYDVIVGWGAGKEEFVRRYNAFDYKLDYMIDAGKGYAGRIICGAKISSPEVLETLAGKEVCIIIYPNIEEDVYATASRYLNKFDTIVSRLVIGEADALPHSYSQSLEDSIFLQIFKQFDITNPCYVDIGVCHPVIRNNTYLLYEHGFFDGLLVEPNPDMCTLISEYRPNNKLLMVGASADSGGVLKYYKSNNPSYRGHNTFDYEEAKKFGLENNYQEMPVMNINEILKQNLNKTPDLMDIDTEGLDLQLLKALDTELFPVKVICAETVWGDGGEFDALMQGSGYTNIANTAENNIYIRTELLSE